MTEVIMRDGNQARDVGNSEQAVITGGLSPVRSGPVNPAPRRTRGSAGTGLSACTGSIQGWHIWRSAAGRWWACRTDVHYWDSRRESGWLMTVDTDNEEDLRAELVHQHMLDLKAAAR
jgi:hypothetical protein